jgi:pimeloyl-ACP methyl ester carboxylesterase
MPTTFMLETAEADIAYDVHGPLPTADGRPPLFMIGQPMEASGFATLASHFPDRTVVTYDPRGLGRSTPKDGRVDNAPHGPGRRRARRYRGARGRPGRDVRQRRRSDALALVAAYPPT